jgi:hypothetical protein
MILPSEKYAPDAARGLLLCGETFIRGTKICSNPFHVPGEKREIEPMPGIPVFPLFESITVSRLRGSHTVRQDRLFRHAVSALAVIGD